jgi:riboflavin kinase / FMN adenylyltransferase
LWVNALQIIELSYPFIAPLERHAKLQVMALGDFDGIHLGHQQVISRTLAIADEFGLPASIMTFHPHPRVVLGHAKYEQSLTPLEDKMALFVEMGIQFVYLINFTPLFAQINPDEFVKTVLLPIGLHSIVVGFDFKYGHEGKGTPERLRETGMDEFEVEIIPPYHRKGEKVSSTNIRDYLANGQLEQANELLGYNYRLQGEVVTGDGRGRTIGFPTANIEPSADYVLPGKGVYAVRCRVHNETYNAVMNIGTKPTFTADEVKITLEAHLFDFNASIYGEKIEVEFVQFIRHERKFSGVEELIKQIQQDAETAKKILGHIS